MNFVEICREKNRLKLNDYINNHPDVDIKMEVNKFMIQNELDIVRWFYSIDERILSFITNSTIIELVKNKQFELLEWLQSKKNTIHIMIWDVIKEIIKKNEVDVLEHLVEHLPCSKKIISLRIIPITIELVQNNQLNLLKWLDNHFNSVIYTFNNYELYTIAFDNHNEELLDWLITKHPKPLPDYCVKSIFMKACISGNIKLAKLLYQSYPIFISNYNNSIIKECSLNGHLDIILWLYSIYREYDYDLMFKNACLNSHIDILKWIISIERLDKKTILECFQIACQKNDVKVISFLLDNCHYVLITRNIQNYLIEIVNRIDDTSIIDIILDTIYLRSDLESVFMVYYENYYISKYILSRYFDLQLNYTLLFRYYVSQHFNDLCIIIVKHHKDQLVLVDQDITNILIYVVFSIDQYKNIELLELLYLMKPDCFDRIRNTLFEVLCERNMPELVTWLISKYPDNYTVVIQNNRVIDYQIIIFLPCTTTIRIDSIDECSICMLDNSNIVTNCNHQFCYRCINKWYSSKSTCPICRSDLLNCSKIVIL